MLFNKLEILFMKERISYLLFDMVLSFIIF
nr:MAG TPA: hypothetical protein [Caudoviricetes sp.]DAS91447.1 MAG TPA: hypothetical protein [Caudoviricetes sp.]